MPPLAMTTGLRCRGLDGAGSTSCMPDFDSLVTDDLARGLSDPHLFHRIVGEVEDWLDEDSSGHDMAHAWRVLNVGIRLAEAEGADIEIVGAAALTHDLHRAMGEDDREVDPSESLPEVRAVLEAVAFPEEKVSPVLHCVEVHDEYAYKGGENPAETVEAEILQDADNLDAIGAIGVARNFAFTGVVGNPLWVPDGEKHSGLGHFDDKLLHLRDEMNTTVARAIAEERHAFVEEFAERFKREWHGEV